MKHAAGFDCDKQLNLRTENSVSQRNKFHSTRKREVFAFYLSQIVLEFDVNKFTDDIHFFVWSVLRTDEFSYHSGSQIHCYKRINITVLEKEKFPNFIWFDAWYS